MPRPRASRRPTRRSARRKRRWPWRERISTYTVIRSPIDGTVVARNVDVGQTVAASLQAPTIFTIAQDLAKMLVYAKVDESDVGRIRPGQTVTFKVDAFPKQLFNGTVSQLRMNATTVQNVVTYDAIIDVRQSGAEAFSGHDRVRHDPGRDGRERGQAAECGAAISAAASACRGPRVVCAIRDRRFEDGARCRRRRQRRGSGRRTAAVPRKNAQHDSAVVWKLHADGTIEPVEIALGITDHAYTEVTKVFVGALKPGDDVVTTSVTSEVRPARRHQAVTVRQR